MSAAPEPRVIDATAIVRQVLALRAQCDAMLAMLGVTVDEPRTAPKPNPFRRSSAEPQRRPQFFEDTTPATPTPPTNGDEPEGGRDGEEEHQ